MTDSPLRLAKPPLPDRNVSSDARYDASTDDGDLQLVTLKDAAKYLSVSRGTLYDLLRTGQLSSVHIGRLRRIPLGELKRFVLARTVREMRGDCDIGGSRQRNLERRW